jgi:AhpC/TSA family protein/cytochrome c biogenesis DsbD-like protein
VQLEKSRNEFIKRGFGVAAISYDSRAVLQNFADRLKIGFPLLSDDGSQVIRSFGILNTTVKPGALDDGVPYPGIFVIDPSGKVTAKYFEEKYQERFTPATILSKQFGIPAGPAVEQKTDHLTVKAQLSQDKARPGNRISLVAQLDLPPKMHIYAPGVKGYRPVALVIEKTPEILVRDARYPKSRVLNLKAIRERVPVYEGRVRLERDFTVVPTIRAETIEINASLEYQACDDQICYAPTKVPLTFSIAIEPLERQRVPEILQRKPK